MPSLEKPRPGVDYIAVYSTYADKDTPNADYLTFLAIKRGKSGLPPAPRYDGIAAGQPIDARVDLGRWIVSCEDCGSGVCIEPDVPVFMCPKCDRSGKWRPVVMPSDREQIEEILLMRPGFRESNLNRFWFPGESVNQLVMENVANGAAVPESRRAWVEDKLREMAKTEEAN
ncbi:MAG: hypothetical protein V3S68_08250 [Dehalococcoidia bacterium]